MEENLQRRYDATIKRFGKVDYSVDALVALYERELSVNPDKSMDEIASNRELCVQVLEQELRITETTQRKINEFKQVDGLIEDIKTKPKLVETPFEATPHPKEPEIPRDNRAGIGFIYSGMGSVKEFFENDYGIYRFLGILLSFVFVAVILVLEYFICALFGINLVNSGLFGDDRATIIVLITGLAALALLGSSFTVHDVYATALIAVLLFPFFLLSIIPIVITDSIKESIRQAKWSSMKRKYKKELREIKELDEKRYAVYQQKRQSTIEAFEAEWEADKANREEKIERLVEILTGKKLELVGVYSKAMSYAHEKIFTVAEEYHEPAIMEKIVTVMKQFRARDYYDALKVIKSDEAYEEQLAHNKRMEELGEKKILQEKSHQRHMANIAEKELAERKRAAAAAEEARKQALVAAREQAEAVKAQTEAIKEAKRQQEELAEQAAEMARRTGQDMADIYNLINRNI